MSQPQGIEFVCLLVNFNSRGKIMMSRFLIFALLVCIPAAGLSQVYEIKTGRVDFKSDAPQELIKATSDDLKGVLNINKKTFAFKIGIASFKGFNSPLQKEHFNENYMETSKYPYAYFSGKIIEDIDFGQNGEYLVRAKGRLQIHGVGHERIVYSKLIVKDGRIVISADFVVSLADHDIKIPRVVYNKLATNISVITTATLERK